MFPCPSLDWKGAERIPFCGWTSRILPSFQWSDELAAPENRRVIPSNLPRGIQEYESRSPEGHDTRAPDVCTSGMDVDFSILQGFRRFRDLPPFREGAKFDRSRYLLPGENIDGPARWKGQAANPILINDGDVPPPSAPVVVAERGPDGLQVHTASAPSSSAPSQPPQAAALRRIIPPRAQLGPQRLTETW